MTQAGALSRALAEHWEILRALRARDPELAQMRAAVHIAGVEEWLRGALSLDRPGPGR
jgi:GntR family transcriptional repressor for pyruvate dehydrogenase complex